MSDYYGNATLEDWLYGEVLNVKGMVSSSSELPKIVVNLFEQWREGIERGHGFASIPDVDGAAFEEAVKSAKAYLQLLTTWTMYNKKCQHLQIVGREEFTYDPDWVPPVFDVNHPRFNNSANFPFVIYENTPGTLDGRYIREQLTIKGRDYIGYRPTWLNMDDDKGKDWLNKRMVTTRSPGKTVWPLADHQKKVMLEMSEHPRQTGKSTRAWNIWMTEANRQQILKEIDKAYRQWGNLDSFRTPLLKAIHLANHGGLYKPPSHR